VSPSVAIGIYSSV